MAQRDSNNASLHDRVIEEVIHVLNPKDYDIYTNPGSQKNAGINDNYPDVIMTEKGNKTVKFIIEVETIDSINLNEAETQWKKFATEINCTFYLLVPDSSLNRANDLCKQVGVNVRFAQYSLNNNGVITFNFN
jgi:hypothetical protein